jgi:hypothetical protein
MLHNWEVVHTGNRDKVRMWRSHMRNNRVEDREVDGIRTLNWECLFLSFFSNTFLSVHVT